MTVLHISVTETAKLLREALRATFPDAGFKVRSRTFGGGTAIEVEWVDGPTENTVADLADRYCGSTHRDDGRVEMRSSLLAARDGSMREVQYGADSVITRRRLSAQFLAWRALDARPLGRAGDCGVMSCDGCGASLGAEANVWVSEAQASSGERRALITCSAACGARHAAAGLPAAHR